MLSSEPAVIRVFRAFVAAVGAHDSQAMWPLLSAQSQAQLGGNEQAFASRYVAEVERALGPFAKSQLRTILSARTSTGFGIAAVAGQRTLNGETTDAAAAAGLVRGDGSWKLDLASPILLRRVAPLSGNVSPDPAIEIRVQARVPVREGGLWLDGRPLAAKAGGSDPSRVLITARPPSPLRPGSHTVVVYAVAGTRITAAAFAFDVPAA